MKLRDALTGGLIAILGFLAVTVPGTYAADVAKPSISKEAAEDLLRMGQTLRVEEFSFPAKTIRVYADPNGEPLHIFHTMRVTVHRPSRLVVDVNGDDGSTKLAFDGKTAIVTLLHGSAAGRSQPPRPLFMRGERTRAAQARACG